MTTTRILPTAGFVSASFLPKGPNGRALCRYCGNECPRARQTFCSGDRTKFHYDDGTIATLGTGCVHEHCLRSQPGYARRHVWARDRGQCALCPNVVPYGGPWDADHIVPVIEGGGACGLENLRTLCRPCHRLETAKLAARRAAMKRGAVQP